MKDSLKTLVENLPEVYQPIFGHTELPYDTSRTCDDRLIEISNIYKLLEKNLGRPLKVLDLGCAQGFFSLSLAQLGAKVQGIDFLDKNIAVCNALADENKGLLVKFDEGRIEDILSKLQENEYDLVLGLSVFHHLVYAHGLAVIQEMLSGLSKKIKVAIFELALQEEPLYWGSAQATYPRDLLKGFSFVHEIKKYPTHLSNINRPLIISSNRYWVLNNKIGKFDSFTSESHQLSQKIHQESRKYLFSDSLVIKLYRLDIHDLYTANFTEFTNEISYLTKYTKEKNLPKLLLHGKNNSELWLVRDKLAGTLLLDIIKNSEDYDQNMIIEDILHQLVILEKENLYHTDLRVWNVIINNKGNALLIDYGSILPTPIDCVMPNNLFLSFLSFLQEIITGCVSEPKDVRDINYDIDILPEPYRSAFIRFFLLPEKEISFKTLLNFIQSNNEKIQTIPSGFKIFLQLKAQSETIYKNRITYLENHITSLKETTNVIQGNISTIEAKTIQSEIKAHKAQAKANESESKALEAEAKVIESNTRAREAWQHYHTLENSNSWKMTKPLRVSGKGARWFIIGVKHWVTFSPTSRPRRVVKKSLILLKTYINQHPKLKMKLLDMINHFPRIRERVNQVREVSKSPEKLSPRGERIYKNLKKAIDKKQGNN